MHDMVLDLLRSLSREANFAIVSYNGEDILLGGNTRRLALQNRVMEHTCWDNHMDDHKARARSFIAFRCSFGSRNPLQSFKLLHMLYLEGCQLKESEMNLEDLLHLRYLGLRGVGRNLEFLEEMGALKFLQVLHLGDRSEGLLPASVGMLTQLVCLHARGMSLPGGITKDLTSLQELRIDAGEDHKSSVQFFRDLGNLHQLKVLQAGIKWMDDNTQPHLLKSLANLHKMQRLELQHAVITVDEAALNDGRFPLPLTPLVSPTSPTCPSP